MTITPEHFKKTVNSLFPNCEINTGNPKIEYYRLNTLSFPKWKTTDKMSFHQDNLTVQWYAIDSCLIVNTQWPVMKEFMFRLKCTKIIKGKLLKRNSFWKWFGKDYSSYIGIDITYNLSESNYGSISASFDKAIRTNDCFKEAMILIFALYHE